MKIFELLTLVFVLQIAFTLPTTFDFRTQPSLTKFADYSLQQQGTCAAHAWGLQLAQIVSNAISLTMKSKYQLSSQHLIECIEGLNQICHDSSLENIHEGIELIQNKGITTTNCIQNKIFDQPRAFCPRECDDGYPFEYLLKAQITKHSNFPDTLASLISNEKTTGFVVVKVYKSMNFYSAQHPQHLQIVEGQNFQYRIGEIVGWKNKGTDFVVRLGLGDGWGYNGFATLNMKTHQKIIVEMHTVKFLQISMAQKQKFRNE